MGVANKKAVKDGAGPDKPRGVGGRPPAKIDADDVWHYARSGATAKEIAQVLGVSKRTIDRRFGPLFRKGREVCATMLRAKLVERALNGDTGALIFACKSIAGLHENGPSPSELDEPRERGLLITFASGYDQEGNPIEIPAHRPPFDTPKGDDDDEQGRGGKLN